MKRLAVLFTLLAVVAMFTMAMPQTGKTFKYVGVKKCKMCHKGTKKGKIYETWLASKHAKAFETLANAESQKIAKEKGIKGSPQEAKECLQCHVTGYGKPAMATLTKTEGVSCEACHGPGSSYKSMKIMKQIAAGKVKGEKYGMVTPDETNCKTCHNPKSPTYKEFKFDEMYKKIEHHIPPKK